MLDSLVRSGSSKESEGEEVGCADGAVTVKVGPNDGGGTAGPGAMPSADARRVVRDVRRASPAGRSHRAPIALAA